MIFDKNYKNIHKFLTKVYSLIEKSGDKNIIYVDEKLSLKYIAFDVCGSMSIENENNVSFFINLLKKRAFYELSKKPGNKFSLDEIERNDVKEETINTIEKSEKIFHCGGYVCELSSEENKIISILTKTSGLLINDANVKYIKKMKGCDVYSSGQFIKIVKNAKIDKGRNTCIETMCFLCSTIEDEERNKNGKKQFEDETKFAGKAA